MGRTRAERAAVPAARPGVAARDQGCRGGVRAARGEAGRPECVAVLLLHSLKKKDFFFCFERKSIMPGGCPTTMS